MVSEVVATVVVTVNNHQWNVVSSLRDAGPNDPVYTLDPETGTITFGDGVNGATVPIGSTIIVSYRYGAGSAGNISKKIEDDSDVAKFWVVVRDSCQILGWGNRA
jgi:hypothetical protein